MLIRSISGVRGLTNSHLTSSVSIAYARALHSFLADGVIMCGRDSRPSGEKIQNVMTKELVRLGRTVIDCGIVPTPTVQFMVHNTEAIGGFIVTASHNPIEWNGLKFVRSDGTFFYPDDCKSLFSSLAKTSSGLKSVILRPVFSRTNASSSGFIIFFEIRKKSEVTSSGAKLIIA